MTQEKDCPGKRAAHARTPMKRNLERELATALGAVREAARLAVAVAAEMTADHELQKEDRSPVTVADFGVQVLIHAALSAAFPADPIVAEEDEGELSKPDNRSLLDTVCRHVGAVRPALGEPDVLRLLSGGGHSGGPTGRFWCLDPVDGTKGFLRGDQYAIALSLLEGGRPVLGVLGCPRLAGGRILWAAGDGAWMSDLSGAQLRRLTVSSRTAPRDAIFCESFESGHSAHGASARVIERLGSSAEPRRFDSQAKYGVVAAGEGDIYLRLPTRGDYQEKIWDHAAGVRIVESAGGRVTDIFGRPLDFAQGRTLSANKGVIATNGPLHDAALAAVAHVLGF